MNCNDRYTELFQKYCSDRLTAAELIEWSILVQDDAQIPCLEKLVDKMMERPPAAVERAANWDKLSAKLPENPVKIHRLSYYWIAAAAVVLLVVTTVFVTVKIAPPISRMDQLVSTNNEVEIGPATAKAVITIDGDTDIALDSSGILRVRDGKIFNNTGRLVAELDLNAEQRIEVPRGGHYQIYLPDGTHVHLNANSILRFPGKFVASGRHVYLTGEGYFDVVHKKSNQPFYVHTEYQDIRVLGTVFNVTAYGQKQQRTTLFEGKVAVTSGQESLVLSPGQESVLEDRSLYRRDADLERVAAWKNNRFIFNDQSFETIVREFAAWYDVDFVYTNATAYIKQKKFSGSLSRSSSLREVLKIFQAAGPIKFQIQERRVMILPD